MMSRILLAAAFLMGLVPTASAQLTGHDKTFVLDAAQINNYEIRAALLADKYSNNPVYRTYAITIANDQTEESAQLQTTVADEDPSMRLPTGVSPSGQRMLTALKNSRNVNATFRNQMIASKLATLRMYQSYIGEPDVNSEIKKMAQGLMTTFERQLEDARNLPPT